MVSIFSFETVMLIFFFLFKCKVKWSEKLSASFNSPLPKKDRRYIRKYCFKKQLIKSHIFRGGGNFKRQTSVNLNFLLSAFILFTSDISAGSHGRGPFFHNKFHSSSKSGCSVTWGFRRTHEFQWILCTNLHQLQGLTSSDLHSTAQDY